MNNYKIVIDASHGGEDIGVTGNGIVEKDFSLEISDYIYNKLNDLGYNVQITRTSDETLNNTDRINKILSFYGDDNVIVISNHLSDSNDNVEIIYALRNSNLLSNYIADAMKNEGINVSKIYQRRLPTDTIKDYYFIHRDTMNAIPILISYGNIINSNEANDLRDYQKYGDSVVNGIINYINNSGDNAYIVKSGDSLYSIAKKYNISVNDLKNANNLNSNTLQIGQKLIIPSSSLNINQSDNNDIYIVKSGDSLYSIARKYNVSVNDLMGANNLNSNTLQIGQKLIIPSSSSNITESDDNNIYVVKRGDSLYSIARKYDTTVSEIMELNNLKTNLLSINQKLKIPTNNLYIVKSGDSLYSIAKKYNTTIDSLKNKNNLTNNLLNIGQILII